MSILTASSEDFAGGRVLPAGDYKATVLEAKVEKTENGKRLSRMYGNLRTRNDETEIPSTNGGSPFRIGNRKLFARSWIEHTNEQAQGIGDREIKREAVSAGLMQKPKKGETVELDYPSWDDYASALLGREVIVRVKVVPQYKNVLTGLRVHKPTQEQLDSEEVKLDEPQAEIAAWLEPL